MTDPQELVRGLRPALKASKRPVVSERVLLEGAGLLGTWRVLMHFYLGLQLQWSPGVTAAPIQISKVATWVCVGDPQYEEAEKALGIYS